MAEEKLLEKHGKKHGWSEEDFEETNGAYIKTNYPEPFKKFRISYESFSLSMEESYFWILNQLKYDLAFPKVDKITDIFSSSENSSMWGQTTQRLGIQQDKIQTLLATVGKMVKDLFALVRELRIIDERLEIYNLWKDKKSKSADVTLKEIFINLVENQGGQMKTSSVYGLASNLGYATLPDWFFNIRVYNTEEIDEIVDKLPTNNNLKNVLRRKLMEFVVWKEKTGIELVNRRKFNLHYLRQHWGVIKMYMGWLKPYLRNVKRLSMNEEQIMSPEIISAFETASLEIEILAYDPKKAEKGSSKCLLVNFKYYVKPSLSYQQPESYQRGAVHVGKIDITMRSYGWGKGEIESYKAMRSEEEMALLSVIDDSIKSAMDALSGDLEKYLAEAGEKEFKEKLDKENEKKNPKKKSFILTFLNKPSQDELDSDPSQKMDVFEPFVAVFMGFGEILGAFTPSSIFAGSSSKSASGGQKKGNALKASKDMLLLWKNYKKSHQLLTW